MSVVMLKGGYPDDQQPEFAFDDRVEKINTKPGDGHQDGARATVAAAFGYIPEHGHGYFVVWDDMPGVPCFIARSRLRKVSPATP